MTPPDRWTPNQQRGRIVSLLTQAEGGVGRVARTMARVSPDSQPSRFEGLKRELTELKKEVASRRLQLDNWDAEHGDYQ